MGLGLTSQIDGGRTGNGNSKAVITLDRIVLGFGECYDSDDFKQLEVVMRAIILAAFVVGLFQTAVIAGEPTEEIIICPVGKERFTVVGTNSCSTMGAHMSLRPVTSCDFALGLPVCPKNGLPVYRDFERAEIKRLRAFMKTDEYKALLTESPYLRAYEIEAHLVGEHSPLAFDLLRQGIWRDRDAVSRDADFLDLLVQEAELAVDVVDAEDKPYILAMIAYELGYAGRNSEAKAWLKRASKAAQGDDFLLGYLAAVRKCLGRMNTDACLPDSAYGEP
ncbi:MAG: hypothetical protein JNK19_14335 [Tabrizicola sp.]|nr:hypothetical protein [Tabrizicola sp.]